MNVYFVGMLISMVLYIVLGLSLIHISGKEPAEPAEPSEPFIARRVRIVCDGGTVNIRVGNGTQYDRITAAKDGSTFGWVATAENGWHAVVVNGRVGWVCLLYTSRCV